jgi:hypothetical protein
MKTIDSFGGPMAVWYGDLIAYVLTESETSINIREIYSVISYSGQQWRKTGYEPYAQLVDKTQEITINKKSLLYIIEPSKDNLESFIAFRKKYGEYKNVRSPWAF